MKSASISDIRKELQLLSDKKLMQLCLDLAKYKKENKEYLSYLLFDANDHSFYVSEIKNEIRENFELIGRPVQPYYAKKSLRKILRIITKHVRFMNDKTAAVELSFYFLHQFRSGNFHLSRYEPLNTIYEKQIFKTAQLITQLHEDLQQDYRNELETFIK